jgi:hypothetical protein
MSKQREAFEAKFPMPSQCIRCGDDYAATGYNAWEAQAYCSMWEGWKAAWQASRAAALEEAAGICQEIAGTPDYYGPSEAGFCADAIRALKEQS